MAHVDGIASFTNNIDVYCLPRICCKCKWSRLRGDMIETFKVVHGFYDRLTSIKFEFSHTHLTHFTRGNSFKLDKSHVHYDIRKHFF
jgi:hypothetical protein